MNNEDLNTQTPVGDNHTNVVTPGDIIEPETTEGTPPSVRTAIRDIGEFKFDLEAELKREEDARTETEATAFMMFGSPKIAATELPKLRTDKWPYEGKKPNPISIGMARRFLAAAYAEVPCGAQAAGEHGYAWIVKSDKDWLERDDVTELIKEPKKPTEPTDFDMKAQWVYARDLEKWTLYQHLIQEGKNKLISWFGKEMFLDLFHNGLLPTRKTPKDLLQHLTDTYALPRDNRQYLKQVREDFATPHDPKEPVEKYFMRLQEARTHARLLGQPYSAQQIMNQALDQFEAQYSDAYKAEKKWNQKEEKDQTWEKFKTYWKEEIHQWDTHSRKKDAHQAVALERIMANVTALQAETQSLQDENKILSQQFSFQQGLMADHGRDDDSISTITTLLEGIEKRLASKDGGTSLTGTDSGSRGRTQELIEIASKRNPKDYANLNGGKGKQFTSYCFNCGVNCTHWTRKCFMLSANDRKKYKDADFTNRMGGSTKFLDRQGKYQSEFAFDSL